MKSKLHPTTRSSKTCGGGVSTRGQSTNSCTFFIIIILFPTTHYLSFSVYLSLHLYSAKFQIGAIGIYMLCCVQSYLYTAIWSWMVSFLCVSLQCCYDRLRFSFFRLCHPFLKPAFLHDSSFFFSLFLRKTSHATESRVSKHQLDFYAVTPSWAASFASQREASQCVPSGPHPVWNQSGGNVRGVCVYICV